MKSTIITTVSAWPEALIIQSNLLKKHSLDDYQFVAIIDTPEEISYSNLWVKNLRRKSIEIANEYCHKVIAFPPQLHNVRENLFPNTSEKKSNSAVLRCADVVQFAWNELIISSDQSVLLLDSDMFPMKDFSVKELLGKHEIIGVLQERSDSTRRIKYFWNGIIGVNGSRISNAKMMNFDAGMIESIPVDVGGHTHFWIDKVLNDSKDQNGRIGEIKHRPSLMWDLDIAKTVVPGNFYRFIEKDKRNQGRKVYSEVYQDTFFHYRGGGNWLREPNWRVLKNRDIFASNIITVSDDILHYRRVVKDTYMNTSFSFNRMYLLAKWFIRKLSNS